MKKVRSVALIILLLVAAVFSALALAGCSSKETFKYKADESTSDRGYWISAASTSISGDIEIPAEYNGKPVFGIGVYGFKNCTKITSITIPDSVTHIGCDAFINCYSAVINIPTSVTNISEPSSQPTSTAKKYHINYSGTKAQWKEIRSSGLAFDTDWEVTCTDGVFVRT